MLSENRNFRFFRDFHRKIIFADFFRKIFLIPKKNKIGWSWKKSWYIVSMQKIHSFRLVRFSERFWHSAARQRLMSVTNISKFRSFPPTDLWRQSPPPTLRPDSEKMRRILIVEIGYVQSIVINHRKPRRTIKSGTVRSHTDIYTLRTHLLRDRLGKSSSSCLPNVG